jgi:hypothetical protein
MPYPDEDVPVVDDQLAGGSCPYCGQPIATPPDPLGELEHN